MEKNKHLEDVSPIKNGDFPVSHVNFQGGKHLSQSDLSLKKWVVFASKNLTSKTYKTIDPPTRYNISRISLLTYIHKYNIPYRNPGNQHFQPQASSRPLPPPQQKTQSKTKQTTHPFRWLEVGLIPHDQHSFGLLQDCTKA